MLLLLLLLLLRGADIAKAGEVISTWTELPLPMASVLFTALFGGACYVLPTRLLDNVNGLLVLGSIASFFVSATARQACTALQTYTSNDDTHCGC